MPETANLHEIPLKMPGFKTNVVRYILPVAPLISTVFSTTRAQWYVNTTAYHDAPFSSAERLQFKVKWGFIRLGTVKFVQEKDSSKDLSAYSLSSRASSAAGLPFVDVDIANSAIVRRSSPRNIDFRFIDRSSSKSEAFYSYDSVSHTALMRGIDNGKDTVSKSIYAEDGCYDPLGFLMLLRCLSGCGYNTVIQLMIGYELKSTHAFFNPNVEPVKIDLYDSLVLARQFEMRSDWSDSHSGGLSGNMTGWISADEAAVPLLFMIRIFIGNVTAELESCSRPGWAPPTASLASAHQPTKSGGEK